MTKLNLPRNNASNSAKQSFLARDNKKNFLGLFALGTLGLHVVILLVLLLEYGAYSNLARKAPPSLVQLADGETVAVASVDNKERTPKVITTFVVGVLTMMMNWSGTKTPATESEASSKPALDPGVDLGTSGGRGKVTTSTWQAGFALSEDFRKEFLQKIAELTPSGVFNGTAQVALVPIEVRPPEKIEEGKWKIDIVANLMVFDQGSNLGKTIPFNKQVFVRAVSIPPLAKSGGVAAVIYQMRSSGLEIYSIRDLLKENI